MTEAQEARINQAKEDLANDARAYEELGGLILFKNREESKKRLRRLIAKYGEVNN